MFPRWLPVALLLLGQDALSAGGPAGGIVSGLEVTSARFDPSHGERTIVTLLVAEDARVTLCWRDENLAPVACPILEQPLSPGRHAIPWDGRDREGRIVPDEAYTPRIEALSAAHGTREVLDPITWSGGEQAEIPVSDFEGQGDALSYTLERPGRVLVRLGIRGGPLLKTLVDWRPRPAGANHESWDGYDEARLQEFCRHPRYAARVTWLGLPDSTVITYGAGTPVEARTSVPLVLSLVESPDNTSLAVRVDVPEAYRSRAGAGLTEVLLYVDNELVAEAEEPRLPYEFRRDASGLTPGAHILTVNVTGVPNQVWTGSLALRGPGGAS